MAALHYLFVSKLVSLRGIVLMLSCFISACTPPRILDTFDLLDHYSGNVHVVLAQNPSPLVTVLKPNVIPESYWHKGRQRNTADFLNKTGTAGLVVIHNGQVVHEAYNYGNNQDSLFASWSVAKSFTSALVGIAIEEGHINNVNDLVINYVPELAETAYKEATIKDVLEMASGLTFSETYFLGSDVANLQFSMSDDLMAQVLKYTELSHPPGTFNAYKSIDTQVLGMILVKATGQSVASYLESRLWGPAGMTRDALWLADKSGMEATFCCMKATTRDFAKLGLIYLNNGFYNRQQIVPEQWVLDSLDTSAPHLQPGHHSLSDYNWGYGYQWWFRDKASDYSAIGIFNQFVYVNPDKNIVIAKNSAAPTYLIDDRENEHFALFRAIAENLPN